MVFLPHTNTVILLEPYCGAITEPGIPVVLLDCKNDTLFSPLLTFLTYMYAIKQAVLLSEIL